jgi:hypothetical protein
MAAPVYKSTGVLETKTVCGATLATAPQAKLDCYLRDERADPAALSGVDGVST